jgi:hypothetical protein
LNLHLEAYGQGQLEITLDPSWPRQPQSCVLHIPQAAKTGISEVLVNHQTVALAKNGTVELPLTDRITVSGTFDN